MIQRGKLRPISEKDPEKIAQLALDGVPLGVREIATLFNALGIKTEKGRPWCFQLVCLYAKRGKNKLRKVVQEERDMETKRIS